MTYRFEIAVRVVAAVLVCLLGSTPVVADTGPGDTGAQDTTGDTSGSDTAGDTATMDTSDAAMSDTSGMDVADTAPADTADAADTAAPDVADTGPADTADAADTAAPDVADTGPADTADAADTAAPDVADTGPADTADAGDAFDIGDAADADGRRARFFGEVEVRSRPDDAGVTIALEQTDGDVSRQQTTETNGRFSFEGLPTGTYEVEISREDYVTIAETFELEGDRHAQYTLHRDQNVDVRIRALFEHVDDPPDQVAFELQGERGTRSPEDGPIAVEDGVAEWTVSELGVGTWTLSASADGFRDVSFSFAPTGPDGQPEQLDLRLYMPPADVEPPPPDTSGCSCSRETTDGGGTPSPTPTPGGPLGAPLLILFSFWCSRRLLS